MKSAKFESIAAKVGSSTALKTICKDNTGNTQCILDKKENTVIIEPTCEQLETFASPGQFGITKFSFSC